jgi:hypothetical protein
MLLPFSTKVRVYIFEIDNGYLLATNLAPFETTQVSEVGVRRKFGFHPPSELPLNFFSMTNFHLVAGKTFSSPLFFVLSVALPVSSLYLDRNFIIALNSNIFLAFTSLL